MGAKITIDSASMMNKGFEVIEAKWLFGVQPSQIEGWCIRIGHSFLMVKFEDGAVKGTPGMPDMRLPIQYAFSYPDRISSSSTDSDFSQCTNLTFEQPDTETVPQPGTRLRSDVPRREYVSVSSMLPMK